MLLWGHPVDIRVEVQEQWRSQPQVVETSTTEPSLAPKPGAPACFECRHMAQGEQSQCEPAPPLWRVPPDIDIRRRCGLVFGGGNKRGRKQMRNSKLFGIFTAAVIVAATMAAFAYPPSGGGHTAILKGVLALPYVAETSYAPWHKNVLHVRVAQSCTEHGQACVLNGTPCCSSADTCKGKFPNTYCQ